MTMVENEIGSESPVAGSGGHGDEPKASETDQPGFISTPLPTTSRRDDNSKEVIAPIPDMANETPSRRHRTPSKFVFLSDRKSVPTELKNLQERTIKRRREYLARIHKLNCHTAKLMSQYAEERMNLDLATCDTFERTVIHPLVTSVERLAIDRESSTNRLLEIPALERRIGRLDAQMIRHTNVTMNDSKIELDRLRDDLERNLKSEFRTENQTFNKIEGGIVQRFESAAGTIARNIHAEGASRRSSIAMLQHKIENTIPKRFERAETTLSEIASLRAKLCEERAKRLEMDKAIYEEIVRRTSGLKRAMIAMASDGEISR